MSDKPIIVEQYLEASRQKVWVAITQQDQMIQWFFENIESFRAELGFKTQFVVLSGDRTFTHLWKILEVEPMKKIVYDWRYSEYSGNGKVTFLLSREDDNILLTITSEGMESFPQDIPEFTRANCLGGWTYFIRRLKTYLDN